MLEVNGLGMRFADKKLFENVSLSFKEGYTYGVIGANGAGKSTFLKIIAGELDSTEGQVIKGKDERISMLGQDHNKYDDRRVTDVVIMGNKKLYAIQEEKDAIYANPEATNEDYERAAELEEKFGAAGGWNAENDAQILLDGLGIAQGKWDTTMSELKAGEKIKVLLAQALFGEPEILIMDEPTNHLDIKAISWLENFLIDYNHVIIIVSHDSSFLDKVCTHTVDIDFGGAKMFTGNYSFWKQSSQLALELRQKHNAKKEDQIKQLKEFIAKFSANASKAKSATSRKKLLDKIELDDIKPSSRKYPYISWDLNRETGKDILSVSDLTYVNSKGETLFENVSFSIHRGEKMALLGDDDIAKTRLLSILMGELEPTSGTVKWGTTVTPDYFPNDNSKYFSNEDTILKWISQFPLENKIEANKDNSDSRMRSFLGRMLFSGDSVKKKVSVSSGGEKARLMFSRMMLRESNFLVLDQPLDHLDTESIDSVIDGVKKYKSGVIFTTYNKTFISETANVILDLRPDASFIFRGEFSEYIKKMGIDV